MSTQAFLSWLSGHSQQRSSLPLTQVIEEAGGPQRCAVIAVDLIVGFCHEGALASPRIERLLQPVSHFLTTCHAQGIKDFLFLCDAHQPDSPEFQSFPAHCLKGTPESKLAPSLAALPFSNLFERIDKRSVSSTIETTLTTRLQGDQFQKIICLGDCTDLCLYHLATDLRFLANSSGLPWEIIVASHLVATYDLPVDQALSLGVLPHPGDLLHDLFLYHLELNGITVIDSFT